MPRTPLAAIAAALTLLAAPAFAQTLTMKPLPVTKTVISDVCMMPKHLLNADPHSPQAVNCLTSTEVNKAKAALRAAATSAKCAVSDAALSRDPFSPQAVSCRTDAQIQGLVRLLKQPVPGRVDDSCMAPRSMIAGDVYGPVAVKCLDQKTVSAAATLQKSLTQDRIALHALQNKISRNEAELTKILGK